MSLRLPLAKSFQLCNPCLLCPSSRLGRTEERQSSRCLKKPLGDEYRQWEIGFLRLPSHLSTRTPARHTKIYSGALQQAFNCHFLKISLEKPASSTFSYSP